MRVVRRGAVAAGVGVSTFVGVPLANGTLVVGVHDARTQDTRLLSYHFKSHALRARHALEVAGVPARLYWTGDRLDLGWLLATSPTPLEEAATAAALPLTETTSDNRERLLYDALDVLGPLGQILRDYQSEWLKKKGAELIELWRRGENLGVLRGERP